MDLIKEIAKTNYQTIVMVTHDRKLAEYADKIIHISDGTIEEIEIIDKEKAAEALQEEISEETGETASPASSEKDLLTEVS
jgi:putative ABC transport system ATP-binding protein